jgi:thiol-disulfide isomerase/thioredoxin
MSARAASTALAGAVLALALALPAGAADAVEPARPTTPKAFRAALDAEKGRVVIVNFWATWCAPCLEEIPDLVRIAGEHSREGVRLIGVAMDDPGALAATVEPFRRRYFPDFDTYTRGDFEMDEIASVIDPAWNEVMPTTYILGRDGAVRVRIQGRKSYEEFKAAVASALP